MATTNSSVARTGDTLRGDALFGLLGNARGGHDRLDGGSEGDNVAGDAESLAQTACGGNDRVFGGSGDDFLHGDADRFLLDSARGGHDRLFGGSENDTMAGDAGENLFGNAVGGNDWLDGDTGADNLAGDAPVMSDNARGGNDRLFGRLGADLLTGDATVMLDAARGGNDVLSGGRGDDRLWGDADPRQSDLALVVGGVDRFVFERFSDVDRIGDFEDDKDVIDLRNYVGIDRFAQVRDQASDAGGVQIDLGAAAGRAAGEDVLFIDNLTLADVNARDFLFA